MVKLRDLRSRLFSSSSSSWSTVMSSREAHRSRLPVSTKLERGWLLTQRCETKRKNYLGDWRWMSRKRLDLKLQPLRRVIRTRKFVLQVAVETKSNPRGDVQVAAETGSSRWEIMCKLFLRAFRAEEWLLESKLNCRESPKSWRQSVSSALTAHPERENTFWSSRLCCDGSTFLPRSNKDKSLTFAADWLSCQELVFPDKWGHFKSCLHAEDYSLSLPSVHCATLTASVALT